MAIGWIGLAAGVAHALSGPDHLAAVAPLAFDRPAAAWKLGLRWGLGHACAVGVIGSLALLLRRQIDLSIVSVTGETLAGLSLVALGVWGWHRVVRHYVHMHEHEHDGVRHRHVHLHPRGVQHPHSGEHRHRHVAFGFGLLHGAGGTSHLLGVLPALALPDTAQAALYVVFFSIGTLLAMMACSGILGGVASVAGLQARTYRCLLASAATLSLVTGGFWILR
jgi:hypothetical protein